MTDTITIAGTFTKSTGQPATGETLTDFDFYLTAVHRTTGATAVIWDGTQSADGEADNVGQYFKIYNAADLNTYHYFAMIQYTGATAMDSDYVYGGLGAGNVTIFPVGAVEFTYTLTDSVSGDPIAEADIWITTDLAGTNVIWRGTTDAFGIARDVNNNKPRLDAGTYYFWRQKAGYTFSDPDTEAVS